MDACKSDLASALVQDLLERFNSYLFAEFGQSLYVDSKQQLLKLKEKLLIVEGLLDSCEVTPNKASQHWVGELIGVCYDIQDLIDDTTIAHNHTSLVGKCLSIFSKGSMPRKSQDLQDRMQEILNGLKVIKKSSPLSSNQCSLPSSSSTDLVRPYAQQLLFGRDDDQESIITMLMNNTVSCVTIVGMAGVGKSSIAQNALADSKTTTKICHKLWVPVSGHFESVRALMSISHLIDNYEPLKKKKKVMNMERNNLNGSYLHVQLCDMLRGESLVIVLDDVWDVKYEEWSDFCSIFVHCQSFRVLVTTRNSKVAVITKSSPFHLRILKDQDCSALIMDRASSHTNSSDRQHMILKNITEVIGKQCKGLPLVANALGLYLSTKPKDDEWSIISQTDVCHLPIFSEQIFPAFRFNNPELGSQLKRCLAYCSLFPVNYNFKKETLSRLWVAEGFVSSQGRTSFLEEIGCHYFEELVMRSFFQLSGVGNEESSIYEMHEFIRCFAEFLACHVYLRFEDGKTSSSDHFHKARHLSLPCRDIQSIILKEILKCEKLRTLLLISEHGTQIGKIPHSFFRKLQRLRVLVLSHSDIDSLPESIDNVKHLRYLDISKTHIRMLPETTSDLHELQVLKLRECPHLLNLPKNIKNLTKLVHLDVDIKRLKCTPSGLGSLTCLQTLTAFIVGKKTGHFLKELKDLNSLRGTVCLTGLGNVKDEAEAAEAFLCQKQFMKRLELEWTRYYRDGTVAIRVLDGLQPHKNVQELQITNYAGFRFPEWLTSPSCMLVSIHLRNCRQHNVLPSLGQLLFLKSLQIECLHNVKYVNNHFSGEGTSTTGSFSSLESLKIRNMMGLEEWNLSENSMHQLRDLTIEDCPNLVCVESLSHMRSLQTLCISYCPELQLLPELPASLKSLIIIESDLVKQDCQSPDSPKWYLFKDIRYVEIDFVEISGPRASA